MAVRDKTVHVSKKEQVCTVSTEHKRMAKSETVEEGSVCQVLAGREPRQARRHIRKRW